jgi:PAS domain S-box-containing protein
MIAHCKTLIKLYVTNHQNSLSAWRGVILFFLISALNVQAQEGVQQRFFTSQNGLKISWVNSITKSQNNAITIVHSPKFYFAKYDGVNFDYSIDPSGILGETYEDFSGNLWSIGEGNLDNVNFFSNNKWQNLEFEAGIPFMPTPNMGNKLLFIRDGDLKEFDKVKQQIRIIKQAEESQIGQFIDMITFQDGSVWVTGEDGIAKYLVQSDDIKEQWIDFQVPKELGLYHFNKPFEGVDGELTFMSKTSKSKQNVLAGFDGEEWQKIYASQTDEIYCGWQGHDNSLWIIKGSLPPLNGPIKDWNLFHVQQGQETCVVKNRILNRILNDIVVEPNGNFWLATGSGLALFSPTLWRKQTAKVDLNRRTKKIHEDLSGRLWFAMENAFSLFSDDKWELHQFNPAVFTGDICSLKNGLLVAGTTDSGGLALFNPVDKSRTVAFPFGNEKIRYYDQDKNGNCFIILQDLNGISRLIRYDGEHVEKLAENLKIDQLAPGECEVTDIIQTISGDIWIVTFTDIIVYKKGIRESFDLKEEFEWGLSTAILELGNGDIWISGNKGILQYDGKNWSHVQAPEFETARDMIIARDSSIWVASGTGIHRLINGTWISNSKEEGLLDAVIFDLLEDKQGKIWAATVSGVYYYFHEADIDAPETVIPSDINPHEAIPSGEIQFMFEGHDKWNYTQDDQLQYSYRFDENSWSPFENKTIVKRVGLSAGSHVFEVRAMDRNGNIDPTPASWPFTVLLPWYKETHFVILLVFAICVIVLSLGFAITRHLQVEKLVLIRTEELNKTKEKAEKGELELQLKNEEYETINEELNQTNENLYEAKENAEESERYLDNIINSIGDPFFVKNEQSKVLIVNDAFCEIFGLSESAIIGKTLAEHVTPEERENFLKIDKQVLTDGVENIIEETLTVRGGKTQTISTRKTRFIDKNGKKFIVGIIRDISDRKQAELVLIATKEKAEESDRLKSAFLTNMSHEIRTPMNGILGFTDLLKEPNLSGEEQLQFIEIIRKSGNRMLNTVNDIIDISKIDAGQEEISKAFVNINEEIETQFEFFNGEAISKGIELKLNNSMQGRDAFILIDKVKLNSIISNLIKNAIKYTDKGNIEILCNKKGSKFEFKITDTGIGIPEDRIHSIFNRFEQADINDTHARQGSGLGLAISKAYVEMLGGQIGFESEQGKGSTFYFTLPWIEKQDKPKLIKEKETLSTTAINNQISILIAEDDETSFEHLCIILHNLAKRIDRVINGKEAVEYMKNNSDIDLVLMDIKMPVMSGYDATMQIRKFNKDVIIIAQTAYALTGDKEKALDAGCNDYISKPLNKAELKLLIQKHIT